MKFEVLVVISLLILIIVFVAIKVTGGKQNFHLRRKDFMTKNEISFWRLLVPAAVPLHVAPQVAMSALVATNTGLDNSTRTTARNSFDRKCVDFVLFDDAGVAQLIVELDDSTHKAEKDSARDKLTAGAGYETLRVRMREAKDVITLSAMIKAKLAPKVTPDSAQ